MKIKGEAALAIGLAVLFLALAGLAQAQLRLARPSLSATHSLRFVLTGADTNQAYQILFAPVPSTNDADWTGFFTGPPGQTAFDLPLPARAAGFFRARPQAGGALAAASFPELPLYNLPGSDSNGAWAVNYSSWRGCRHYL